MKENYSIMCEDILNNLNGKKKLLLHSCCGPCSSYVISYLTNYFDITILYYNPNIYPYDEYLKRKDYVNAKATYISMVENLCSMYGIEVISG